MSQDGIETMQRLCQIFVGRLLPISEVNVDKGKAIVVGMPATKAVESR